MAELRLMSQLHLNLMKISREQWADSTPCTRRRDSAPFDQVVLHLPHPRKEWERHAVT